MGRRFLVNATGHSLAALAVVLIALAATGVTGAILGGSRVVRATLRVVIGGGLALVATFVIGSLLGTSGIG